MMLVAPSFNAMRWLKVADNSVDYSLGNTTKQALWLPTSREAKYKAKQAVDSFFVRAGDVVQAGLVFAGERLALRRAGVCRREHRVGRRVARRGRPAEPQPAGDGPRSPRGRTLATCPPNPLVGLRVRESGAERSALVT